MRDDELLGRDRERARLHAALRRLATGSAAVQLVGEAGIGKSALLAELAHRAAAGGALVVRADAAEFEQDRPYGPLADALEPHLPLLDLDALGPGHRASLAAALPALGAAGGISRPHVHRAVAALLDLAAAAHPLVLVLDDLHWADPETAALVGHLVRSPGRGRVLLAVAHRPLPPGDLLAARLDRAVATGSADRVELGPLDDEAATALVATHVPEGPARDALLRACGGNPFHLRQLARSPRGVPGTVTGTILAEVATLDPAAAALLRGAATVGDPFDLDLAAVAAGQDPDAALDALDTLVAAALVVVGESPRVFRFRHPLVRRTVRGHTAPGWSARAHGRIAAALAAAGARPEARAPHVAQAAGLGDRDAARLLVTAADAVVARSPATAARWLADALRLLPGAGAALRHDLLGRRAHALTDAGRLDDAVATLREILALGAADRTAVVAACARTEYLRGRPVAALELLDAEPSAGARERAVLATERAAITLPADPVRAAEHAAEAVAAARYIGGRALRTRALALQALALVLAGDPRGVAIAGEAAGEVADSGVAGTEPVPVGRAVWTAAADPADTLRWLGEALTLLGRPSGIDHLRRGLDLAATGPAAVSLRTALGFALARQGRLPRARLQLDDAVDHARLAGSDELLAQALTVRCHVRTWTGDLPGALADGRRAVDLSAHRRDGVGAAAAMFLADALLQAGDPAAAVDTILDGAGGPELALLAPALRADGAAVLAEAALATGRVALARAAAGEAGPGTAAGEAGAAGGAGPGAPGAAGGARPGAPGAAARGAAPAVPSPVLRARALLAVHDGRTDARELAAGARTPLERLRARLVGADRAELLAVAEAADELGATTIAAAARAGAAGRALTDRERAVAELIAAGHSNRRIGAELYLAERTVERYVSAVLAKLGAPNRAAVGGLLRGGRSAAPG